MRSEFLLRRERRAFSSGQVLTAPSTEDIYAHRPASAFTRCPLFRGKVTHARDGLQVLGHSARRALTGEIPPRARTLPVLVEGTLHNERFRPFVFCLIGHPGRMPGSGRRRNDEPGRVSFERSGSCCPLARRSSQIGTGQGSLLAWQPARRQ